MAKIAVVGECMAELYMQGDGYKQTFAGDTFNCAVYLKRSSPKDSVEYISVLGKDSWSKKMTSCFKEHNLDTNYLDFKDDKTIGLYIITTDNGERSFSYWRGESAAKELFTTPVLEKIKEDISSFDMIYFSAISLAIMNEKGRNSFFETIQKARETGVKIVFDTNYRPKLYTNTQKAKDIYNEVINYCDIVLPSIEDEEDLWGVSDSNKIIEKLKTAGVKEIILKAGKEDIMYYYQNEIKIVKIKALENIVDSTSAGDSFNGAYLSARLKGDNIEDSILKGQELASKVIMHKGAIV
ncbi:MAG: ketodeoxygluconokinase [Arcobacter sp.]|nr:ketodeoxygluconokinase [Arcobacter sp.]|tara:strand:- start:3104 stop:3991 length:888 start_codon:yes stop_codon:yes gene_type:complete